MNAGCFSEDKDMNLTAISGFILAAGVIWFGVLAHAGHPQIFLDQHALILVLGGTLSAALIAFPLRQYKDIGAFLFLGVLFPPRKQMRKVIADVLLLSGRPEPSNMDPALWGALHPYLQEGYLLGRKLRMTTAEYKMILLGRRQRMVERYSWDAKILTALAKFPPAFGLLGASTGMIAMMSNLGTGGKEVIGPSMAIALVATFWGIALANLVFLPLADRAMRLNTDDDKLRTIVTSGLILIHEQVDPAIICEHLVGFLPLDEREDARFQKAVFGAQNQISARLKKAA
jgi:chemotaxis protein MotA